MKTFLQKFHVLILIIAAALLFGPRFAFASPTVQVDDSLVYLHVGPINLTYPVKSGVNAVVLVDLLHQGKPYAGVETPIAHTPHGHFIFAAGGVTDVEANGTPFLRVYAHMDSLPPGLGWLNDYEPGAFASRNFFAGVWMTGFSASKKVWGPTASGTVASNLAATRPSLLSRLNLYSPLRES